MFALSERDLELTILGCGDGPASFNAEASRRGSRVVSCDPIYEWSASEIRGRVAETYEQIIEQTRRNAGEFVWTSIPSVEELGRRRMGAMEHFWTTTMPGKPRADTSTVRCRCCRSLMARSTSRCARICCFSTRSSWAKTSTRRPFASSAAWRAKCASFRCWRWAAGDRRMSIRSPPPLVPPGTARIIETVPYEFRRGGNQMMKIER